MFELRELLGRLHRDAGAPSLRALAREISRDGGSISHTTVNTVLKCEKRPRWRMLILVVRALGGDLESVLRVWVDAGDAEDLAAASGDTHR